MFHRALPAVPIGLKIVVAIAIGYVAIHGRSASARESLGFPFDSGQTWHVTRGYNCLNAEPPPSPPAPGSQPPPSDGCPASGGGVSHYPANRYTPPGGAPYGADSLGLDLVHSNGTTNGQNLHAVFSGKIVAHNVLFGNSANGCFVTLRGDDGNDFIYEHTAFYPSSGSCDLDPSLVPDAQDIHQGQVIANVGTLNHIHLQWCDHLLGTGTCPHADGPTNPTPLNEGVFSFYSPSPRTAGCGEWCGATLTESTPPTATPRAKDGDGDGSLDSNGDLGNFTGAKDLGTGNGFSDLIHSSDPGHMYLWAGSATGLHNTGSFVDPGYHNEWGTWYVGDFNGDRISDLVHSAASGQMYFWKGTSSGPQQMGSFVDPGYHNEWGTWYVGDFNGDGTTDLIHSAGPGQMYFWQGTSSGPQLVGNIVDSGYHNEWGSWYVGDFDGDGKSDLVHSAALGQMYWWRGTTTGPVQMGSFVDPGYHNEWGSWYVGDFDGDAKSDLVHSAAPGQMYWWRGTTTGPVQMGSFVDPGYHNEWGSWYGGYAAGAATTTPTSTPTATATPMTQLLGGIDEQPDIAAVDARASNDWGEQVMLDVLAGTLGVLCVAACCWWAIGRQRRSCNRHPK